MWRNNSTQEQLINRIRNKSIKSDHKVCCVPNKDLIGLMGPFFVYGFFSGSVHIHVGTYKH
jgi:hypothetical protein